MCETPRRHWHIIHSESEVGWGGQEHRILAELRGFRRRGSRVCLLAASHSHIYQRALAAQLPVQRLRVTKPAFPLTVAQTAVWLRRQQPDVLNTHSSRDGWMVGLAGRLAGVPFILRTRHFDMALPHRRMSRHVYRKLADHVVTTSQKITNHFRECFGLSPDRITTVPTGIDLSVFGPDGPKTNLWPGPEPDSPPVVGMISVLRRGKGHSTFLQAARHLVDSGCAARFVIVGEGTSRPPIERELAELRLVDHVRMLGHREDVEAVLRSLDVLVIPSLREGIPQVGLQALATQTPLIGSNVGGIPEIVRHGETGRLFPPGDPEALAQAIRDTLESPEATRAMARRGRALVESQYSLDAMLDTMEALYRRYLPV